MASRSDTNYAGIGSDAVKAKTVRNWTEWLAALDKAGASSWSHQEIAKFVREEFACPDWWTQMVTVGYEQARGLRVKHQVADGFSASVSKTIAAPISAVYASWSDPKSRRRWLKDYPPGMHIRKATTNKCVRIAWTGDKSDIDVRFTSKGTEKCQVAVEQRRLGGLREVARMKSYWSETLERLRLVLESSDAKTAQFDSRRQPSKSTTGRPAKRKK